MEDWDREAAGEAYQEYAQLVEEHLKEAEAAETAAQAAWQAEVARLAAAAAEAGTLLDPATLPPPPPGRVGGVYGYSSVLHPGGPPPAPEPAPAKAATAKKVRGRPGVLQWAMKGWRALGGREERCGGLEGVSGQVTGLLGAGGGDVNGADGACGLMYVFQPHRSQHLSLVACVLPQMGRPPKKQQQQADGGAAGGSAATGGGTRKRRASVQPGGYAEDTDEDEDDDRDSDFDAGGGPAAAAKRPRGGAAAAAVPMPMPAFFPGAGALPDGGGAAMGRPNGLALPPPAPTGPPGSWFAPPASPPAPPAPPPPLWNTSWDTALCSAVASLLDRSAPPPAAAPLSSVPWAAVAEAIRAAVRTMASAAGGGPPPPPLPPDAVTPERCRHRYTQLLAAFRPHAQAAGGLPPTANGGGAVAAPGGAGVASGVALLGELKEHLSHFVDSVNRDVVQVGYRSPYRYLSNETKVAYRQRESVWTCSSGV